jgi:signal peptidase I
MNGDARPNHLPGEETWRPSIKVGRTSRLSRLLTGLLVAAGVVVLALGLTIRVANVHFQTVVSNSMRPTVSAGDVAITQAVPMDSVRVGDVITFYAPASTQPVMHRITSLRGDVITTRGDANPVDDPWHITLTGTTAYRLVAVVPFLGWLTELQRPALLVAGLLVGLTILLELRKEVKARVTKSQPQPHS